MSPASHMAGKKQHVAIAKEAEQSLGYYSPGPKFAQNNHFCLLIRGEWRQAQHDLPNWGVNRSFNMAGPELKTSANIHHYWWLSRCYFLRQFPW
jgi:hypothetical protein